MKQPFSTLVCALLPAMIGLSLARDAIAQSATFDFDNGIPLLSPLQGIPFDQSSGGVTAHFSSPSGASAFSVQNYGTTTWALSRFSGNYLAPSGIGTMLRIDFNRDVVAISLTFAANSNHGGDTAVARVTALSSGGAAVGQATAVAQWIDGEASILPQGTLSFDSGGVPFRRAEVSIQNTMGVTGFLADDIAVTYVASVNHPPAAVDQPVALPQDSSLPVTLGAADPDGDPLTYAVVAPPAHGALSGTAPGLTYTPNAGYFGPDSFTFKANDGTIDSNVATVTITVSHVNHPPVSTAQALTVAEDTPTDGTLAASDLDNDPLTFSIVTLPVHGSVTGAFPAFTYTPAANYNGPDAFTFKVSDGATDSAPATVSLNVTPVNDPPVVTVPGPQSIAEGAHLVFTVSATDADGETPVLTATGLPVGAVFTPATGAFAWTPNASQSGGYTVHFTAADGAGAADARDVAITVTNTNRPPTAAPQSVTLQQDASLPVTLGATDPDGDPLTYAVVAPPVHGLLAGTPPAMTYAPAPGYSGPDSFTFRANDGAANSNVATVSISVIATAPVNHPPTAGNLAVSVTKNAPKSLTLPASDPDGDPLSFTVITGPSHGTLSGIAPALVFTPVNGYAGPDSFTFRVSDGAINSGIATVSVTVVHDNLLPKRFPFHIPGHPASQMTLVQGDPPVLYFKLVGWGPNGKPNGYAREGQAVLTTLSGCGGILDVKVVNKQVVVKTTVGTYTSRDGFIYIRIA